MSTLEKPPSLGKKRELFSADNREKIKDKPFSARASAVQRKS